jgi:hypothetical protein
MRWLTLTLLIALALPAQEGIADHCDNASTTAPAKRCACEHTECPMGGAMSSKCQTYCKPESCACVSSCGT